MTTTQNLTGYRMQCQTRDLAALLDPEQQYSFPMSNDDELVRHGVSCVATLPELAAYLAVMAIEAGRPSIVRISGPMSDDEPLDADMGEMLLLPVEAERIDDDAAFFELVSDLVDLHWDEGVEFSELLTIAETRI